MSPRAKAQLSLNSEFDEALDQFAYPTGLEAAQSSVPRTSMYVRRKLDRSRYRLSRSKPNIHVDEDGRGRYINECYDPARHPRRDPITQINRSRRTREKLEHSVAHGCPLGWYIDPERRTIDVYRPGLPPERLAANGFWMEPPFFRASDWRSRRFLAG